MTKTMRTLTKSIPNGFTLTQLGLVSTNKLQSETHQPPAPDETVVCQEWFAACVVPVNEMDARSVYHASPVTLTSYTDKHRVEIWTEEETGTRQHIYQGAFIQAALNLGYEVEPIKANGRIKQSMKIHVWLREDDWKRVWPTGFSRWLFRYREAETLLGHLARDTFNAPKWPRRATSYTDFQNHLSRQNTNFDMDILNEAWESYQASIPANIGS